MIKIYKKNDIQNYGTNLGIITLSPTFEEYLQDTYLSLQHIADEILIYGPQKTIRVKETVEKYYNTTIYNKPIPIHKYAPEWVTVLLAGQILSKPFQYMKYSLYTNPFINQWTARLRYLWDYEDYYRADGPYNRQTTKLSYRYNPQKEYIYDENHYPINPDPPTANCMLDIYSYRFFNEDRRRKELKEYVNSHREDENQIFSDLMSYEIYVEKVIEKWLE